MQPTEQSINVEGATHIKGKEFVYIWRIHNFNSLVINDVDLDSPRFSTNNGENVSWFLQLSCEEEDSDLTIMLYLDNSQEKIDCNEKAYLTISIIDYKGKEKITVQSSFYPKIHDYNGREFLNFVKKEYVNDEKNGLVLNGTLTIKCKIFFFDELVKTSQSMSFQKSRSCDCNLKTLFETKKLSDTVLIVGAQKFETHKCILAARSKVFSAMFEHDMKEKNDNTVKIEDIEPQVIDEMLQFIYCGKTEDFQDVSSLLIAADKYQIDDLKSICENQLMNDLNAENVGKALILADNYKADVLKKRAIQFILMHPKEINFEQFKTDIESHSPLLVDMLSGLI